MRRGNVSHQQPTLKRSSSSSDGREGLREWCFLSRTNTSRLLGVAGLAVLAARTFKMIRASYGVSKVFSESVEAAGKGGGEAVELAGIARQPRRHLVNDPG